MTPVIIVRGLGSDLNFKTAHVLQPFKHGSSSRRKEVISAPSAIDYGKIARIVRFFLANPIHLDFTRQLSSPKLFHAQCYWRPRKLNRVMPYARSHGYLGLYWRPNLSNWTDALGRKAKRSDCKLIQCARITCKRGIHSHLTGVAIVANNTP